MTRLAVIGDVHAHMERLQVVLERVREVGVDGVLLVGDIGQHAGRRTSNLPFERRKRYLQSVQAVIGAVQELWVPVLWVPGNHDFPELTGEGNVDWGVIRKIGDLRVTGIGGAGPERFGFWYEWGEDEIRSRNIPDHEVLLCHAPPHLTPLDWVPRSSKHAGSVAIREIAQARSRVLACGHIHESAGTWRLGECLCLNAGGLGEPHGRAQVGFIEGTDKVWWEDLEEPRRAVLER